jgi:hypothetical protein
MLVTSTCSHASALKSRSNLIITYLRQLWMHPALQEAIIYVFTIKEGEAEAERVYIVMTKSVRYRVVAKDGSQYRRGGAKLCNG